jgi:hypothetical protein
MTLRRKEKLPIWGSIRRECLDHVVVFGERHLRHLLRSYKAYYNGARTHLSLNKDAPVPRAVQAIGRILRHQFSEDYTISMFGFDFRQGHRHRSLLRRHCRSPAAHLSRPAKAYGDRQDEGFDGRGVFRRGKIDPLSRCKLPQKRGSCSMQIHKMRSTQSPRFDGQVRRDNASSLRTRVSCVRADLGSRGRPSGTLMREFPAIGRTPQP